MSLQNGRHMTWRVASRQSDFTWEGELLAYWEASFDPISDSYTPDEIDARPLFDFLVERVQAEYPDGLVPISWFVTCPAKGQLERMPFQFNHGPDLPPPDDFLTFFTWPVNTLTGEPLNWLTLPVVDKRWHWETADKGGFIQQATGWKPSILQPFVYLESLLRCRQ